MLKIEDANGKAITDPNNIAQLNRIRYRGYYWDAESSLYYCMSRYYDPQVGRFINADGQLNMGVLGKNAFAYCNNNPVNFADPTGTSPISADMILAVANMGGMAEILKSLDTKPAPAPSKGNATDFANALGFRESTDRYTVKSSEGYLGRYQMGSLALQDAGFKTKSGSWTALANSYQIYSESDFLNSPSGQDAAFKAYSIKQWDYVVNLGLDSYIGTEYQGVVVTQSGLVASAHLVGIGNLQTGLVNGIEEYDKNNTSASSYMSSFGGYDLSDWLK